MKELFTVEEAILICNYAIPVKTYFFQLEKFRDNIIDGPVYAQNEFGEITSRVVGKIVDYDPESGICKINLNIKVDYRDINRKVDLSFVEFPFKA